MGRGMASFVSFPSLLCSFAFWEDKFFDGLRGLLAAKAINLPSFFSSFSFYTL